MTYFLLQMTQTAMSLMERRTLQYLSLAPHHLCPDQLILVRTRYRHRSCMNFVCCTVDDPKSSSDENEPSLPDAAPVTSTPTNPRRAVKVEGPGE